MNTSRLPDSSIKHDNIPFGWLFVKISDVCEVNPPKPPKDFLPADAPVTFVPMPAVDADQGAITNPEIRPYLEVRKGFTSFRDGDVIMAKITPCMENGKAAIIQEMKNGIGFGSTEFHVLRSKELILPQYLYYFIRQVSFRKEAEDHFTGSVGQKRVPTDFIKNAVIPLPPLPEQHRIVVRVEALLTQVNAARDRLNRVPLIMKRFRQAVLVAACSGRLTEGWREEHPDVEHAENALNTFNRIFKLDKKKIRKRGTLGMPEIELPDNLPESWTIKKIKELVDIGAIFDYQDGNHGELYPRQSDFGEVGVKFLTATQVFDNKVQLAEAPLLKKEKALQLRIGFAQPRDVLLTHNATVGRVALMPDNCGEIILGTSVTYYRLNPEFIDPNYCCFMMQGPLWQSQLRIIMEQTTRNQVSITKQAEFFIPIPPILEQHEIVRHVNALFMRADQIEHQVGGATKRTEALTQAVMAKAFRGELVATEAELSQKGLA